MLSSHSTTFHAAATVCLGEVALWARLQEGPGEQPRQTRFRHRSQSWLGLSRCQPQWPDPPPPTGRWTQALGEGLDVWRGLGSQLGEPQERQQGQGRRPEGFPAQPSTLRQAFRNWTHRMAAHYSVALGHGARWIAPYTLAMERHLHLPWEPWKPSSRGPLHSEGSLRGSVHSQAGRE